MKRFLRLSLLQIMLIVALAGLIVSISTALYQRFCVPYADHVPLAISPDGSLLAAGISTMPIKIWDAASNKLVAELGGKTWHVQGVVFADRGKQLISAGYDQCIRYWDVDEQRELKRIDANQGPLGSLALSPDESILASGGDDGTVKLWNRDRGEEIATLLGHGDRVLRLAFSPRGDLLASIDRDGGVQVCDVRSSEVIFSLPSQQQGCAYPGIAFGPNDLLAIARHDKVTLELRRMPDGQLVGELEGPALNNCSAVAFSPDGKSVALGHAGIVSLHDLATRQLIHMFGAHRSWVDSLVFSNDGKTLFSGSFQNSVMKWDVVMGRRLAVLQEDREDFPWEILGVGAAGAVVWFVGWTFASRQRKMATTGEARLDNLKTTELPGEQA